MYEQMEEDSKLGSSINGEEIFNICLEFCFTAMLSEMQTNPSSTLLEFIKMVKCLFKLNLRTTDDFTYRNIVTAFWKGCLLMIDIVIKARDRECHKTFDVKEEILKSLNRKVRDDMA